MTAGHSGFSFEKKKNIFVKKNLFFLHYGTEYAMIQFGK